ncbi:MAG: hypothetical protein AAGF33_05820 [Pseudomonadota bacterium]
MEKKSTSPEDFLDSVVDEHTFLQFLQFLAADWEKSQALDAEFPPKPYASGARGWENGTIGQFLESAAACGMAHLLKGGMEPNANPWKEAACIIYAGKIYE